MCHQLELFLQLLMIGQAIASTTVPGSLDIHCVLRIRCVHMTDSENSELFAVTNRQIALVWIGTPSCFIGDYSLSTSSLAGHQIPSSSSNPDAVVSLEG